MDTPRYQHDCDDCVFLGHYNQYDLYVCAKQTNTLLHTIIARYGEDGKYKSGMVFRNVIPELGEAFKRACEKGIIKEKDYEAQRYIPVTEENITVTIVDNKKFWNRDDVQFPRLLSEINEIGLTEAQFKQLKKVMNLTDDELLELFSRAEETFEAIKEQIDSVETDCVICGQKLKNKE